MTPADKEETMKKFEQGKTNILVATSVVEVGVNVPNATVILIEGAERFGLAQLHQLRGRVLRSTHQSYCFALPESSGETTRERMKAFMSAKNGFELAEYDLALRGAGELAGGKQWGVSDIAMEALKNIKLVEAARTEAAALVERDPTLKNHPAPLPPRPDRQSRNALRIADIDFLLLVCYDFNWVLSFSSYPSRVHSQLDFHNTPSGF